jgi:hypothetical protein
MPRLACALFTNMLLAGLGLKLKQAKGDEVNGKPDQEEEKEVGRGGGGRPGGGVAEIGGAGTNLCCSVL